MRLTQKDRLQFEKELCERSFADFIVHAWKHIDPADLLPSWHIRVLADHLQSCYFPTDDERATGRVQWMEGKTKRLLINICPGSLKSTLVNVMFPAWVWTRDPSKRILSTSHKEDLAIRDSLKTRRLIKSEWYQRHWPIEIRDDQDSKAKFENTSFGAREASPFKSITGSRGNILIVDDPHSVEDAKSDAYRSRATETFLDTIPSRLNDPENDVIIVVMQRLHQDDVSGVILDKPDLGYTHLCIPLIADGEVRPPTSIGWVDTRPEGECMQPTRWGPDSLKGMMTNPFSFAGQYQQRPVPKDDGYFDLKWFNRYHPRDLPKHLSYYVTSDHAPGGRETSDWNVVRIWGVDENRNLWLVDSFRKKCKPDEMLGIIRDKEGKASLATEGALPLIRKYRPLAWFPENDNTWVAISSFVTAAMMETNVLCRVKTLPTKGSGDKMGKALAYQAMAAMGLVHLPVGQVGDEALAEYATFPNGRHDDQVDADGAIARVLAEALPAFVPSAAVAKAERDYDEEAEHEFTGSDACW